MSSTDFNIAIGANISEFQAGMVGVRNSVSNTLNNINAKANQFNTTLSKAKSSGIEFAYAAAWVRRHGNLFQNTKKAQALILFSGTRITRIDTKQMLRQRAPK